MMKAIATVVAFPHFLPLLLRLTILDLSANHSEIVGYAGPRLSGSKNHIMQCIVFILKWGTNFNEVDHMSLILFNIMMIKECRGAPNVSNSASSTNSMAKFTYIYL